MPRTITDEDAEIIAQRVLALLRESSVITENSVPAIEPGAIYLVKDAARLVRMHPMTLREKLSLGVIKGRRKHGGMWRILGSELLKLA